jgi:hypothetical protein
MQISSGVLDLTFVSRIRGTRIANVKSTPLALWESEKAVRSDIR